MRKKGCCGFQDPHIPTPRTRGKSTSAPAKKPQADSASSSPQRSESSWSPNHPVSVYRVEAPDNQRVSFDYGQPHVSKSFHSDTNQNWQNNWHNPLSFQDTAYLNFGNRPRAEEFLAVRHGQGRTDSVIKAFDVPRKTYKNIRKSAVDEASASQRGNEHRPVRVDIKAEDQYGLTWDSLQLVNSTAIHGSGRVEQTSPDWLMHPDVSAAYQRLVNSNPSSNSNSNSDSDDD